MGKGSAALLCTIYMIHPGEGTCCTSLHILLAPCSGEITTWDVVAITWLVIGEGRGRTAMKIPVCL